MKLTNNHLRALFLIGLLLCLTLWTSIGAHAQVPPLYRDTTKGGSLKGKPYDDPALVRSKNIIVSLAPLRNQKTRSISVPVFGGKSIVLTRTSLDSRKERLVWKGRIEKRPGSSATIIVSGNVVIGNIYTGTGRMYQIRYVGNGVHSFQEIDRLKIPNEGDSTAPPQEGQSGKPGELQAAAAAIVTCTTDPATEIDVLVLYTAAARAGAGGINPVQTEILLAVEETNDSYASSQIRHRVRVAHMQEVDYAESALSKTDLHRLQNPSDGFVDNAHTLRNAFAADVVLLIVETLDDCGRAFFMGDVSNAFEKSAFGVVRRPLCATGNFSFGHEIGHIMSARHDRADDEENGPFEFNHGFVELNPTSTPANPVLPWRTIMAVRDLSNPSDRIQFWSNPNVNNPDDGDPTGVATGSQQADNARTLNATAPTVANFRCGLPDKNKIWTTVGSDGAIDRKDVGKVFLELSVARMGRLPGNTTARGAGGVLLPQQTQSAVIRYNVTPADTLFRVTGGIELKLNYLATSSARVVAKLITVDLETGTETVTATFDSRSFPSSSQFQVRSINLCGTGIDAPFDFERNAFYVEVTLSTSAISINSAAAVKMIKVSKADCE